MLCFMAGANSIFSGEKLLTTGNPDVEADRALFEAAGLKPIEARSEAAQHIGLSETAQLAVGAAE
jgi:biotin synthase